MDSPTNSEQTVCHTHADRAPAVQATKRGSIKHALAKTELHDKRAATALPLDKSYAATARPAADHA